MVITTRTPQQQRQQEEEEEDKKKKEEQKQPRKKNPQPLNYDEAILLLEFFSLNNPMSFKSYCDTHADVLGEQASDKRKQMQDQYSNWKKQGLPSKYNDASKYPDELVRSASFRLSLIAKQKVENHRENNNSNRKGNETPRTPPPISSPLLQRMKHKSRISSMVNFPITPDDVRVTLRFPLNIDHPYMNIQGALPFRIPSCPQTRIIKGEEKIVGYHDKLCFHLPCWDITEFRQTYKAWLHPDGSGLFVMMPPTGRCFMIQQDDGLHHCEMTRHRVEEFFSWNHPFRIIVFYEFPNNMVCSNEVFNDIDLRPPVDLFLVPKRRATKNWIIKPGMKQTRPDGDYEVAGGILWEMEIVSEDNIKIYEQVQDADILEKMFANMEYS